MSRRKSDRQQPPRSISAPDIQEAEHGGEGASEGVSQPSEEADTHPVDPRRTRSGRFKRDFVHNEAGRRGKRGKAGDTDLAALLRAIAHEPIEGVHPVTGKPLTVVEGLARSLIQIGFKQPRIGLALLELMVRSGAMPLSAAETADTAITDDATLSDFLERALRQERARTAAETKAGGEATDAR